MSLFSYLPKLYSLDTLDTRFTSSSKTPPKVQPDPAKPSSGDVAAGNANGRKIAELPSGASPSLWKTPEFFLYYLIFLICVPQMFKAVYDVSQPSHPNYKNFESLLEPGWIAGRKVDNSDSQYSTFRDNVPYMFILVVVHPLLRKIFNLIFPIPSPSRNSSPSQYAASSLTATARLNQRITFDLSFALVLIFVLHGFSALKVLFILYTNYAIATKFPRDYVVAATWIFNIGTLFANELFSGYRFGEIAGALSPRLGEQEKNWGNYLDDYGGLIPRWEILFNITVLRLISFNMDYHWSLSRLGTTPSSPLEKKQLDPSNLSERDRVDIPARQEEYSFRNYLAYALYSPLYLTGPILTFNDYISQVKYAPKSVTTSRTVLYGIRFIICLLTMEVMLHFIYAVAISKAKPAWEVYTPFQLSMLGYFNLHIIWLKLLLPWRFFRFWALVDGIDPPENMVRCMSNNYSALAFWRGWHRSFNRWIVRYIYIPLGGSGGPGTRGKFGKVRAVANYLAVFTFVALWHDIQLRLLMWGWLITLFILPEILATLAFPKKKWQNRKTAYRILCGIGAVGNILMMMAANLVGFAVGLDGLQGLVHGIIGSYSGLVYLATACLALFVGTQVMFEVREQELRQGVRIKC